MRGDRIIQGHRILVGAEPPTPAERLPIVPILGMGAIGLLVVAVVRDEHRASREKW